MAESGIDNLIFGGYDAPQSDSRSQKLLECILTGNSKLYLGKIYTGEQINKLSDEEVDKLFSNYEAKLSGQMVKSLGKSIINMYSMAACAALRMSNQDALNEELENDPFLNPRGGTSILEGRGAWPQNLPLKFLLEPQILPPKI